ncbi:fibronectin type III domain-containing protein [Bacillus paranthracis]|nr:fibronectin type III domain-containing protein [Bacillus paranthracis]
MCLSVLPSFASAATVDLVNGKNGYIKENGTKFKNMTDGNLDTEDAFYKMTVYFDLGEPSRIIDYKILADSKAYVWSILVVFYDKDFKKITDFSNGTKLTSSISDVKHVSLTFSASSDIMVKEFNLFGDDGKISNVSNLDAISDVNKITLNWKNPSEENFSAVKIYKDNNYLTTVNKPLDSYVIDDLKHNTPYVIKVSSVDTEGVETTGVVKTFKTLVDPKTIPPSPVSSLTAEPTDKTVKLKWKKPKDDDLTGFKILQNGKQVAEIGLEEEFTVKNLKPLTDYTFGVMAVDRDKNDSSPVNLSVKTLEEKDDEPPLVPSNVFAKPSNGALIASWDKVSDKDLAGYNVYVDDKKINSNLVSSTNFTIKNLENNRKYKIQVQAVDRSGNASALSLAAYGTPDERTLPIIESKYSLQDVSDGVGVMFGQFWTVLAFAVGIPLAFYIIYKLKLTVLP